MNIKKSNNIIMFVLLGIIVISLIVFGITIYNGSKPVKLSSDDIKITVQASTDGNENEKIITVEAGEHVLFYSFDGGNTYQTDNKYKISENKTIEIVLQDSERRVIGTKKYNAVVVKGDTSPIIDINSLPSEVGKGSKIDLNDYVTATDKNNNKVTVTTTGNVDTSKPGTYDIKYTATDESGQTTEITTQIVVSEDTKPTTSTKKTYYRYRTKTVSTYACNYYSCDYTDHNQKTDSTVSFDKNSYCCNVSGCTKSNPQVSNPCPSLDGYNCLMNMVPLYTTQGNVCYSREYIRENGPGMLVCKKNNVCYYEVGELIPNPGESYLLVDINNYNSAEYNGQYPVCDSKGKCYIDIGHENPWEGYSFLPEDPPAWGLSHSTTSHYKQNCSTGEIKIDGYCHKIDSYGTTTCPSGYVNENGTCYKRISKTCNSTCTNVSWSKWSNWSTTKVLASDTVEVQTKTE